MITIIVDSDIEPNNGILFIDKELFEIREVKWLDESKIQYWIKRNTPANELMKRVIVFNDKQKGQ